MSPSAKHSTPWWLFTLVSLMGWSLSVQAAKCPARLLNHWGEDNPINLTVSPSTLAISTRQIVEIAQFVEELRQGCGSSPLPFQNVCVQSAWRNSMAWLGPTLYINAGLTWPHGAAFDSQTLWNHWNRGKMFPAFSKLKSRWHLLNPAGTFRTQLRSEFRASQCRLHSAVTQIQKSLRPDGSNHSSVAESLASFLKAESLWDQLPETVRGKIQNHGSWDEAELRNIFHSLLSLFSSPEEVEDLTQSVCALTNEALEQEDIETISFATGVVAVTNFHRIGVSLALARPGLRRYAQVVSQRIRHYNISLGLLVGVATGDSVSVKVTHEGMLASAAIERVFSAP